MIDKKGKVVGESKTEKDILLQMKQSRETC